MKRLVITGVAYGDEGKGKITDYLSSKFDCIVRFQGGDNAGHTVIVDDKKYDFHLLPSGILHPDKINVMSNGMVINPFNLLKETSKVKSIDNLYISNRAHLILPYHQVEDSASESNLKENFIGTTGRGIGPTYTDKARRSGIRVGDLLHPDYLKSRLLQTSKVHQIDDIEALFNSLLEVGTALSSRIVDTSILLNKLITQGKSILFEGAQGVMLCLDHGNYPYVTSSSPCASSVPLNTGIAPWLVEGALGITKAYFTKVGEGVFVSEFNDELSDKIRVKGNEYGVTTKRPRRIGWFDSVIVRHSARVSGISYLAITLLDVLAGVETLKIVKSYNLNGVEIDYVPDCLEDLKKLTPNYISLPGFNTDISNCKTLEQLPNNAKKYLSTIEELTGIKIALISVGPERNSTIEVIKIYD